MAHHARPKAPKAARVPRALLRAGFVVAAGAALGAGGAANASAAEPAPPAADKPRIALNRSQLEDPVGSLRTGVQHTIPAVTGLLKSQPLYPLGGTGLDPLSNGVGAKLADFKSVGTNDVTGNLTRRQSLDDLPVVGPVARRLPGGWHTELAK
ncbi:hypothetical protein ACH429_23560 [Streptomyces pathocidini]|uniref:Secreted protein n=1 Tax=Streptomyces pathocidini TaxID=1650571 RepID=A0ABW7UWT4_9ACTN|nr:hypothetical protein [Streptomyces pathocidini]